MYKDIAGAKAAELLFALYKYLHEGGDLGQETISVWTELQDAGRVTKGDMLRRT